MATDYWTDGTANWDTAGDWSAGLPDASSDVVDQFGGTPEVTASFGTVEFDHGFGRLSPSSTRARVRSSAG